MSIRTLIGLAVFVVSSTARCTAQQLSATDRAPLVARLWSEARHTSSRWNDVHANLDSGLAASLRAALQPQSDLRFWLVLRRLAALLGNGQAAVVAPEALRSRVARPPLALTSVEGRPFIADYAANDEMRVARPERLAEILSVQVSRPTIGSATPSSRRLGEPRPPRAGTAPCGRCFRDRGARSCNFSSGSRGASSAASASPVVCR